MAQKKLITRNQLHPVPRSDVFTIEEDGLVPAPGVLADKFLRDDGTWQTTSGGSGTVPTGTGFRHITSGTEDAAAKLVTNSDVSSSAAIVESKLSLNFPTHTSANDPSSGEKAALAGTTGTPGNSNRYVTDSDARLDPFTTTQDGLVLASGANTGKFLRGDGTWATPSAVLADGDYGDIVLTSSGTVLTIDSGVLSSFGRTLIDDANAAAARTTLGLGTAATSASTDFLSSSTSSTQTGYFGDIKLKDDTNPSHYLAITDLDDLSADRTLSITVNNADRTISLSGNLTVSSTATVSGTNTGDQHVFDGGSA